MGVKNPAGENWEIYRGPTERRSKERLTIPHYSGSLPDKVKAGIVNRLRRFTSQYPGAGRSNDTEVFSADAAPVLAAEAGNVIAHDGVITAHDSVDDVFGHALVTRNAATRIWRSHDVSGRGRIALRRVPFVTVPETPESPASVLNRARSGELKFEFTPSKTMAISAFGGHSWTEPQYVPTGSMEMDPTADRYGQAIFGGLRAVRAKDKQVYLFRPQYHAERFNKNARALVMPGLGSGARMPGVKDDLENWSEVGPDALVEVFKNVARADKEYIPDYGHGSLYLAPGMRATGNQIGVKPNSKYVFTCLGIPAGKIFGKSAALWMEKEFHRASVGGVGGIKASGNYAPTFWVKHQMHLIGADDIVYQDNENTEVRELSSSNLFFITKDGVLVTPELNGEILNGCTRDSILTIARELMKQGIITGIEERAVLSSELSEMVEAFSCGTGVTMNGVEKLMDEGQEYRMDISAKGMGPITRAIYDKFNAILAGEELENEKYNGWMVPLNETAGEAV